MQGARGHGERHLLVTGGFLGEGSLIRDEGHVVVVQARDGKRGPGAGTHRGEGWGSRESGLLGKTVRWRHSERGGVGRTCRLSSVKPCMRTLLKVKASRSTMRGFPTCALLRKDRHEQSG